MGAVAGLLALRGWKLGGAIAGLLAIAGIVAALVWLIRDHDRLRGVEHRALVCEAAVKNGASDIASSRGDTTTNCPQAIADAAARAQRYLACDTGLKAGDLYAVRAACSAAVKVRDAQATASAANGADLAIQLADARGQLTGALARADARSTTLARKDRNAQAAIAKAPRADDGRITCDDRCLRDLAGE